MCTPQPWPVVLHDARASSARPLLRRFLRRERLPSDRRRSLRATVFTVPRCEGGSASGSGNACPGDLGGKIGSQGGGKLRVRQRLVPAQPQPPAPSHLARSSSSQLLSKKATIALPGFVAIAAGLPTAKPLGGLVRRGAARDPFAWGSSNGVAEGRLGSPRVASGRQGSPRVAKGRPGSPRVAPGRHRSEVAPGRPRPRRCHTPPVVLELSKESSGESTGSLIRPPTVLPRWPSRPTTPRSRASEPCAPFRRKEPPWPA